ncbi:beta-lactamase-like protein [Coniochaeta sp. 2T2.1]|nr:beta-lactamase-like protein [Coniochaeta sp. 2T2.1]
MAGFKLLALAAAICMTPVRSCDLEIRSPQDDFPPARNHTLCADGNVAKYFHNAFAAGGATHYELYNMICPRVENANAGKIAQPKYVRNESIINATPRKVFDDLFFVGEYTAWESSPSSWAIDTGDGIVLIDTLNADSVGVIESGLKSLGMDPNNIKYIIVGHGHADHYGGARYLQDKYHAHIMMSEIDYNFMYANTQPAATKPTKDLVITDGQVFTLGNTSFHFFITPGHTPGTVSTIFNTREGATEHMVAQWGGTGFGFNGATGQDQIDWFLTYADSALRFQGLIRQFGTDVMIANHPILDMTVQKNAAIGSVKTNPWIIGVDSVANYTEVAKSCALAGAAAFRSTY